MFVAKDKSGHVIISENVPVRQPAYWKAPDHKYLIINSKYAEELFPDLKWEDEPKSIEIKL